MRACFVAPATVILLGTALAFAQGRDPKPENGGPPNIGPTPCAPFTIAKGDLSGFGLGDQPEGGTLILRSQPAWAQFWASHTRFVEPRPPLPDIDFGREVVIAAILGPQPTTGSANIAITSLERVGTWVRIGILEDRRPSMLPAFSNPFHLVTVPKGCLPPDANVLIQTYRPVPGSATLDGRVLGTIPGTDAQTRPLAGVLVQLLDDEGEVVARSRSGGDGTYFFVNVPPGEYLLHAQAPGFHPYDELLMLPPNARIRHDIVLFKIEPQPSSLSGRVFSLLQSTNTPPTPLGGALVQLFRDNASTPAYEVSSANDGTYAFDVLLPGPYLVRVSLDGYQTHTEPLLMPPGQDVVRNFFLRTVPQASAGVLTGRVFGHGATPTNVPPPLPGVRVAVVSNGAILGHAMTNQHGIYHLQNLPPGTWNAVASKLGWSTAQAEVVIVGGEVTMQNFVLSRTNIPPGENNPSQSDEWLPEDAEFEELDTAEAVLIPL
ncbi:MAG: carboxypeptidase regulatory-like domain-containing protein [Phycisphaerales bacterium]|nr:carboxypeptidase regulatory-like domain-containing protein [Phycisphaerales bacterium]